MSEEMLEIKMPVTVSKCYAVIGIVSTKNGCCADRPVLITVNRCEVSPERPAGINYSCQCACGGWCTNGHADAAGALAEYEAMSAKE